MSIGGRNLNLGISLLHLVIRYKALQSTNAHRFALDAPNALALALMLLGTYTTADRRQTVGGGDDVIRLVKIPCCNTCNKLRDPNSHRASGHAGLVLTVQTAGGFLHCHCLGIAQGYFLKVPCPHFRLLLRHRHLL